MQTSRRFWILFCCFVFLILAFQIPPSTSPKPHLSTMQPSQAQTQFSFSDMLSGGVWAKQNHLDNKTAIIPLSQANSTIPSALSGPSSSPSPQGIFTNNIRVTGNDALFPLEDEPSIAVTNQSGHVLMVVGANSISQGLMPAYYSKDQGITWNGPSFLPLSNANDSFGSDPGLAVNRTGTFFYSYMSIGNPYTSKGLTGDNDVAVATSTDGGNWTVHIAAPRRLLPTNESLSFEVFDKPYITVGPSAINPLKDTVYVTYTDFVGNYGFQNATIMEVHSNDGGLTWSKPVAVSPVTRQTYQSVRLVQGSMPAVDPRNGALYVAYFDTQKSGFLVGNATVMITRSLDNGQTFSYPVMAGLIPYQLSYCSSPSSFGTYCYQGFRWWITMCPSMDIAPDGTIYITYGARQSKTNPDPSDIYLVASTDGGFTWTQPLRVNDASSQNGAFFSWLKVSSDGVVHIIWGDRRLDQAQTGYDIFYTEATSHGTIMGSNIRVTDVGTDPLFSNGFIGDYFNMAVSGNQVYPVWTDGRRAIRTYGRFLLEGETDIFTTRLGARDVPSITMGTSPPAGYQVPVQILGSGLPREAFFAVKMNGVLVQSQTYGLYFFFTDKTGSLSDVVIPNVNYYGAYPVELDEWFTGAKVTNTSLYVLDTRSLQVSVTGPSSARPGDDFTWNLQLNPPSGSLNPQGYSSTLTVTGAHLTYPNGTIADLTTTVTPTGPTSFALDIPIPAYAPQGVYTITVEGSQTGLTVQSRGIGSTTFTVAMGLHSTTVAVGCNPAQVQVGDTVLCLATVTSADPGTGVRPTGTVSWGTSGSGTFSSNRCALTGTGISASCWVSYIPNTAGSVVITAIYSGDAVDIAATQPTIITVTTIGLHSTTVAVGCNPAQLQVRDTVLCLATVTDADPGNGVRPTGTISWGTSGSGTFSSTSCTLNGSGISASCSVSYIPNTAGPVVITAIYNGSAVDIPATQPTIITVNTTPQNTANAPQNNTLMLGAITGGAGVVGLVAGLAVGALVKARKPKTQAPTP